MPCAESRFEADDGTLLFRREWLPERISGSKVILVHGFGDHSGRYEELARSLLESGHGVFAFDLRGHGRSPGLRGHIRRWQQYRDDLACFIEAVVLEDSAAPVLVGHSMGGLIVLEYLLSPELDDSGVRGRQRASIRRAAVSAPLLERPRVAPWRLMVARLLSRIWPGFSIRAGIDPATLSRSEKDQDEYRHDPLVHGVGSARLATELACAQAQVHERAHRLSVPLLICHGDADRLVPIAGSRRFATSAAPGIVELKEYSGACHELHNDLARDQYFSDLCGWMKRPPVK
jgi:alpha-beta hydrolase superfamily lysophospholipase